MLGRAAARFTRHYFVAGMATPLEESMMGIPTACQCHIPTASGILQCLLEVPLGGGRTTETPWPQQRLYILYTR